MAVLTGLVYVSSDPDGFAPNTSRLGTVKATKEELLLALGQPHFDASQDGEADGKVTFLWKISTPRGDATIHDYWWNAKNEQSIGAADHKAALWVCAYLRRLGFEAKSRARRKWW